MITSELSAAIMRLKTWNPLVQCAAGAHRKPRWLPVAKSKIYRIPKRPDISEDEKHELKRINNNYHTQMRALRYFYHEEMMREKHSRLDATSEESLQQEALDLERCMKINEEWNSGIAAERALRLAREQASLQEKALARMEVKDRQLHEQIERANQLIRKEKEASKTFITAETLDAAIEHALANPIDYNFAIDSKGNRYVGRDANSSSAQQPEQELAAN